MCHFITLIAPSGDQSAVSIVMARHGRAATPISNPSVSLVLEKGERQYLTTPNHCDCGTALLKLRDLSAELAKETAKLVQKGWSRSKIDRAISDRREAAERPTKKSADSLSLWADVIDDLLESLKLTRVGLLVHYYSGSVKEETFVVTRRDAPGSPLAGLESMRPDELVVFRKS